MTKQTAIEYLETDISRLGNTWQNEEHKDALQMGINALQSWAEISDQLQAELDKHEGRVNEYDLGIQVGLSLAMVIASGHLLKIQGIESK